MRRGLATFLVSLEKMLRIFPQTVPLEFDLPFLSNDYSGSFQDLTVG
jgi:hypothetical protein